MLSQAVSRAVNSIPSTVSIPAIAGIRAGWQYENHFVVINLIFRNKQTNICIEIKEIEGGVRATSFLCLVGIGLGLGSLLLYRLCTRVFTPAIPPEKKKRALSATEFPENATTDKNSPETPDSGIAADMGNQESDRSVPVTPGSPEDGPSVPTGGIPQPGLRFRGNPGDFQERDGYVFVNKVNSRPNSMASLPLTHSFNKCMGGHHNMADSLSSSDFDVSHRRNMHRHMSERNCDLGDMPASFLSTNSDLGFYSGHFADRHDGRRGHRPYRDAEGSPSEFSTPNSYSSESLIERSRNCMQDMSFISNSTDRSANASALGHQGPIDVSTQSLAKHSTPNQEGAPVKFTFMSSCINQDGGHTNGNHLQLGNTSPYYTDSSLDNSNINYASFNAAESPAGTTDDVQNNNGSRGAAGNSRFGHRASRRPASANNACWPPGREGGMKRQRSYGSDLSGLSDYSVRDGLRDKGYSVDLGENLSGLDTPDSEMFEAQDVGGGTVSHIELIQTQLQSIRMDIEEMNNKVEGLNSREDIARDCYTLGCGGIDERLRVTPRRHRRQRSGSFRSRSSSLDRLSEDGNAAENRRSYHYQGEFMWDYQSDLAHDDNQFVARRPFVGDDVFASEYSESEHSRSQSPRLEHIKKYLEDSVARSPINTSEMDRSQTINSIADLYIDDDFSGLAGSDANANLEPDDTRRRPYDPHSKARLLRPSPPGRSVSPGAPARFNSMHEYNDVNSPGKFSGSNNSYHSPKLKVHHNICPSCSGSNLSIDACTSTSPIREPSPVNNTGNNNFGSPVMEPCDNCSPVHQVSHQIGARATPPGSLKCEPKWSVVNVGEKCNLYEYAATEWKGDTPKAVNIRKGYHQIPGLLNLTQLRRIRGDNYCALRATLYQSLVNNHSLVNTMGSFEQVKQDLKIFNDYRHYYLKSWSFANRLPFSKDSLLETLTDCIKCFYKKAKMVSNLNDYKAREEFLLNLLNQNPDVDVKLLEAIKILMMLKAIRLYDDYTSGRNTPVFAWLLFARDTSETPEGLFKNHINVLGDSAGLEQENSLTPGKDLEIEMFLLGHTLGVKIEVVRPSHVGADDFISHYPDEGADSFPKVYLIAEDDRHYNIITA